MISSALRAIGAILVAGLVLAACGGGGGGGAASTAGPPGDEAVGAASILDVVERNQRRGVDGIIVTVLDADGEPRSYSAGTGSRASGAAMDPGSPFKIASVSKLFIATAAVQVIHQGLLSLDDSLASQLPELSSRIANAGTITVRQLLQHRSGVPDFDSQPGFSWQDAHTDLDTVLGYALDLPADFPPDARYEYSNTNYLLLGRILDTVLGYSHHQYIQSAILDPLGLRDTFHLQREVPEPMIRGYWDDVDTTNREYDVPGGSMVSTSADVARFIKALARGELLDAAAQATYEAVYWYQHSGWVPGYQTIAGYESFPGVTIVVQVNNTGGVSEAVIGDTYDDVLEILRR